MPASRIYATAPVGKRFGRVVVVSNSFMRKGSLVVMGRCDCGDERPYFPCNLQRQKEPMCPSCRRLSRPAKGQSGRHPLFNIWKAMIQRCENPNHTWYHRYGGRGVTICKRWREDFTAFAADMGERPSLKHTIDRIDPNGNYEPGNVRWLTVADQQNNRGNTQRFVWEGREITIKEAVEISGLEHATIAWRLKQGWAPERIMQQPSLCPANKGRPKRKAPPQGETASE